MNVNQDETKRAAQEGDLPPLPRPHSVEQIRIKSDGYKLDARFTADQMREYARLALAAAGGGVPQAADWFAVAMNAAASLEDAANCLRDVDAQKAALGAAKHVREKCNALWLASSPQPEAAPAVAQVPQDFESWVKHYPTLPTDKDDDGYADFTVEMLGRAWQAAQKANAPQGAFVGESDADARLGLAGADSTCRHDFAVQPSSGIEICQNCGLSEIAAKKAAKRAAPEAPAQADNLTAELQQRCSDWGVYWRAPDAHGVVLTVDQATELLREALGVEVEIKESKAAPSAGEVERWKGLVKQARDALSVYQGFVDDAHILEGQWHWIDDAKATIDAIDAALSEQP